MPPSAPGRVWYALSSSATRAAAAEARTQGRGNCRIRTRPSGRSQMRMYQESLSRSETNKVMAWLECEFNPAAKLQGQTQRAVMLDCRMVTVSSSAKAMAAIESPVPRRLACSLEGALLENSHQVPANVTEKGTKDSFARAPNTPKTGKSQLRPSNRLTT